MSARNKSHAYFLKRNGIYRSGEGSFIKILLKYRLGNETETHDIGLMTLIRVHNYDLRSPENVPPAGSYSEQLWQNWQLWWCLSLTRVAVVQSVYFDDISLTQSFFLITKLHRLIVYVDNGRRPILCKCPSIVVHNRFIVVVLAKIINSPPTILVKLFRKT